MKLIQNRANLLNSSNGLGATQLLLSKAAILASQGKKVAFISFEMTNAQVMARIAALLNGEIGLDKIAQNDGSLVGITVDPMFVEQEQLTIADIIENHYDHHGGERLDYIFIDNFSLFATANLNIGKTYNEVIYCATRDLNQLAKVSGYTILANITVNRESLLKAPKIGGKWLELDGQQIGAIYLLRGEKNQRAVYHMNGDFKTVMGVVTSDVDFGKYVFPAPTPTLS